MLSYKIYTSPDGVLLADWSMTVRELTIETTRRGYGASTALIPLNKEIARIWYATLDGRHLVIYDNGRCVYEGRIEITETAPEGLRLTAFGYSRAYSDIPVSDMWSTMSVTEWKPVTTDIFASRNPDMYEMDTDNRVFIGLQKGTTYPGSAASGLASVEYMVPNPSTNKLQTMTASYSILLPVGFTVRLDVWTAGYGANTAIFMLAATGALQTGTISSAALAGRPIIHLSVFNTGAPAITPAVENGVNYARLTNVRLTASTAATVTADEVVRTMVSRAAVSNPLQVSTTTALIKSPGFDLKEFAYDQVYMEDVLDQLAALAGDGYLWSWRVWDQQLLIFDRMITGAQTFQILATPAVSRDLGSLRTRLRPVYTDAEGKTLIGTVQISPTAEARYGVQRIAYFSAPTTSAADANALAGYALLDQQIVNAWGDITVTALYQNGQRVPLTMLRSGDSVQCAEFPLTGNIDTDKSRTFRAEATTYDHESRSLTISPEQRAPKIDTILARYEQQQIGR